MSKKFSQFTAKDTVADSDYVNVTGTGVNRRVAWPDFLDNIYDRIVTPFIYPTIVALQESPLRADEDDPVYVRVEETEYRLYKITNIVPGPNDITLDNGNTATAQVEYRDANSVQTVATVADLADSSFAVGVQVETRGCLAIGDGGQGDFIVTAASGSPDGYSRVLLANGNHAVIQPDLGKLSLLCFGAVSDTDCTAALTRAKAYSSLASVKIIVPRGTFLHTGFLVAQNGVTFRGVNRYQSVIKLADGVNTHACELINCENITLERLTIDQNRAANLTGGHGIRFGGTDGITLDKVIIKNCHTYGIGMQAGTNKNIDILNCVIQETGEDGIDIKDYNEENENISIVNLKVKNHGLDSPAKPAVDWRGQLTVDGLHVSTTSAEAIGIRARLESTQGPAGSGNVSNITLTCLGDPTNSSAIVLEGSAVAVDVPRKINISNVVIKGYERIGLFGDRTRANIKNVSAELITGDCFLTYCAGVSVDGLRVTSCDRLLSAQTATTGFKISDFVIQAVSNASFAAISAGATNIQLNDGEVPSGKTLGDNSANTTIRLHNVINYTTKTVLVSDALAVDSTGTRNFSLTHGLPFTPRLQDVQITVSRDSGAAGDHRITLLQVDAVTSTVITGRAVVTTASATVGATVKVTAKIETKYSI